MTQKLLVFDLETTHVLSYKGCIHQLSALVIIDDQPVESLNLYIRPHELAVIDPQALKISNVTPEIIAEYPHRSTQFKLFTELLERYVDPYDSTDKFTLVGFKNASFDDSFLRNYFVLEDGNFGSYFWQNTIDTSCLASVYLLPDRARMPSFKLSRVYEWVTGNKPDATRLHDSLYDVELTYEIYKIVRGKTIDDFFQ